MSVCVESMSDDSNSDVIKEMPPALVEIIYKRDVETVEDLATSSKRLNIVHFNDVYNIESRETEPVGGAARFVTVIEDLINKSSADESTPTLVLFSGDAISPSSISMLVKGKQMIEILNECHLACACLGNHDFDFGMDVLLEHVNNSNFPWLISNVFDAETKRPLGDVSDKHIIQLDGLKIGLIGLVENEWIATLSTFSPDDIIYESYVDVARRLVHELKVEHKCDLVFAMTHMRWNNDTILAEQVPEIDLFLGGHDHDYVVKKINERWVVKSGTDFRELSLIRLELRSDREFRVNEIAKYNINSSIEEKTDIKNIVDSYLENINQELDKTLGTINADLDGRFAFIRTQETNLGNFITDIMLEAVNADCALINSGTLRSDAIHPQGEFKVRDLKKILPYLDESVCISATGAQLHQALENSVSQYPKHEGRFLQVAGIKFAFDPSKPAGQRVDPELVIIQGEYLEMSKTYSVLTKTYLKAGKDGYECLMDCPILIEDENIPMLITMVENHFKTIRELKENRAMDKFRCSIVPLAVIDRLMLKVSEEDPSVLADEEQAAPAASNWQKLNFHNAAFLITRLVSHKQKALTRKERIKIKQSDKYKKKMKEYEEESMRLAPKVEGRIVCIKSPEHHQELLVQKKLHLQTLSD